MTTISNNMRQKETMNFAAATPPHEKKKKSSSLRKKLDSGTKLGRVHSG